MTTKIAGLQLNLNKSNTQTTQLHEARSYSYIVVRCNGQTTTLQVYRGSNAVEHFRRQLQHEEEKIKQEAFDRMPMKITKKEQNITERLQ